MTVVMVSSCGGSKQSSSIRKIEKHSKKYPIGEDGLPVAPRSSESKKARQAIEKQQKQQAALEKEAQKSYRDALTRHRELQTPEVRDRMDQRLKETEKNYGGKKEFFVKRWFRPKNDVEKIEKRRAKEVEKRMADARKKAEKNNDELRVSSVKTSKERKLKKPDPKDMPQGGGGNYNKGNATKASPKDMPQGGGGNYNKGNATKASPKDMPQGGGGSYQESKSKKQSSKKKSKPAK